LVKKSLYLICVGFTSILATAGQVKMTKVEYLEGVALFLKM